MRFFVFVLLVLLLPLRGGLGDAMAASGPHHVTPPQHHPQDARTAVPTAHGHGLKDCAGHQAGHGLSGELVAQAKDANLPADGLKAVNAADAADAACDACSACQSCHAVGLAFSSDDVQTLPAPNAQPRALSPAFASAAATRDQKPPIS